MVGYPVGADSDASSGIQEHRRGHTRSGSERTVEEPRTNGKYVHCGGNVKAAATAALIRIRLTTFRRAARHLLCVSQAGRRRE